MGFRYNFHGDINKYRRRMDVCQAGTLMQLLESSCTSYNYQSVVGLLKLDSYIFLIIDGQIRSCLETFLGIGA